MYEINHLKSVGISLATVHEFSLKSTGRPFSTTRYGLNDSVLCLSDSLLM